MSVGHLTKLVTATTDWRFNSRPQPDVWAYAAHCQTDTDGRPVAAVVVICRDRLTQQTYKHQATVQVLFSRTMFLVWVIHKVILKFCLFLFFLQMVIHELFHVLGFSKDLFPTWTDCSTSTHGYLFYFLNQFNICGCLPFGHKISILTKSPLGC